jgi:DnaJ family protein C protein 11
MQQRTNPTSKLQMTVNATDLFERYMYGVEYDDVIESTLPTFEVTEVSFAQTIEAPLTNTDKLVLAGNVSAHNGNGSGSVGCTLRRVTSDKSWHEFDASFGNGPTFGAKLYRKLSTNTFVNMSGITTFKKS